MNDFYTGVVRTVAALIDGERNAVANMANVAAQLGSTIPDINWAGFYLPDGSSGLVLGPFWGKPACIRIGPGKGVCGKAAAERITVVVDDVLAWPDHIACDAASRSEIAIPILSGDKLVGILDVDSPSLGRFTDDDRRGLETVAQCIGNGCDWQMSR